MEGVAGNKRGEGVHTKHEQQVGQHGADEGHRDDVVELFLQRSQAEDELHYVAERRVQQAACTQRGRPAPQSAFRRGPAADVAGSPPCEAPTLQLASALSKRRIPMHLCMLIVPHSLHAADDALGLEVQMRHTWGAGAPGEWAGRQVGGGGKRAPITSPNRMARSSVISPSSSASGTSVRKLCRQNPSGEPRERSTLLHTPPLLPRRLCHHGCVLSQ